MTSQVTRLPAIIEDIGDFASMTHLNAWGKCTTYAVAGGFVSDGLGAVVGLLLCQTM